MPLSWWQPASGGWSAGGCKALASLPSSAPQGTGSMAVQVISAQGPLFPSPVGGDPGSTPISLLGVCFSGNPACGTDSLLCLPWSPRFSTTTQSLLMPCESVVPSSRPLPWLTLGRLACKKTWFQLPEHESLSELKIWGIGSALGTA